jgi:beta-galactosidase
MNRKTFLYLLLICSSQLFAQNFWEDPSIVDEGKFPPRTDFVPYADMRQLLDDNKFASPFVKNLNGTWKFKFAENVAQRPVDFYSESLNDNEWSDIQVPASWETQGFGVPVYSNSSYIFPLNPPFVDNNDLPIGSYRTWFEMPASFEDKEVFLYFGSISGAATIYINGKRVGYSKAAKTPAEFNITPLLKKGKNLLALQVFKWSDASYLEDQDFWRLAGIERDVLLIAHPKVSVEDFFVNGDLDKQYRNGILKADIRIRNFTVHPSGKYQMNVSLLDAQQKTVFAKTLTVKGVEAGKAKTVSLSANVNTPKQWSAEYPHLYTFCIELKDEKRQTIETTGCQTGFRKIEIRNRQLLINGKPIRICGVNMHEHNEKYGHYVDEATQRKDVQLMKLYNYNAIRTSHYPQPPEMYKLCNRYGLYVVDEANIEAHGMDGFDRSRHPSFIESWKGQHLDRTVRMFERDKNHPCIIGWSLGNESDFGPNYETTYNWLKQNDKAQRPVQCNRTGENKFTDIVCPMYHKIEHMERYAQNPDSYRPYIQCEYAHAMGNSTGNFQELWDIFDKYDILQGGFIWDWMDQGLAAYDEQGRKYWGYGGDFGGHRWTHDENFCANGMINADHTVHPGIYEVKKSYQPIQLTATDLNLKEGKIRLYNRHLFTDLNAYAFWWELYRNGELVRKQNIDNVSASPLSHTDIVLQWPEPLEEGKEYYLRVRAFTVATAGLVPEGHEVASEEFALSQYKPNNISGTLKTNKTDHELRFESGHVKGAISLKNGQITNYTCKGRKLITAAPTPNFWRAPTDNDFGNRQQRHGNVWRTAGDQLEVTSVDVKPQTAEGVEIVVNQKIKYMNIPYTVVYLIRPDGSVKVSASIDMSGIEHPELSRFGMKLQIPLQFDNVTYYGRGPWENYNDRNRSAFVGKYACKVDELAYNYIRPQENGYRTDVRIATFTGNDGSGVSFECDDRPFCFNARHNTDDDFDPGLTKKQQHSIDIDPRRELHVNIDLKQLGVGGDDSWGARPLKQYRMLDDRYAYSYVIKPAL